MKLKYRTNEGLHLKTPGSTLSRETKKSFSPVFGCSVGKLSIFDLIITWATSVFSPYFPIQKDLFQSGRETVDNFFFRLLPKSLPKTQKSVTAS